MQRLLTSVLFATLPVGAHAEPVIVPAAGSVTETVERLRTSVEATGGRVPLEAMGLALRLALAAQRAGHPAPPVEALALLASEPGLQQGLRAIFAGPGRLSAGRLSPGRLSDDSDAGALSRVIEDVAAEARLYEEVLTDG